MAADDGAPIRVDRFTKFDDLPDVLWPEEAAAYLGVKKSLIYARVRDGSLPAIRLGKLIRIEKVALAALAGGARRRKSPTPSAEPFTTPLLRAQAAEEHIKVAVGLPDRERDRRVK